MYCYMSTIPCIDPNGDPTSDFNEHVMFSCRGEISPGDDPEGFKRMMQKKGYMVVFHKKEMGAKLGTGITRNTLYVSAGQLLSQEA